MPFPALPPRWAGKTAQPPARSFRAAGGFLSSHPMHIPARLILIVFAMSWVTLVALWVQL
jgi:hypothetical protein